MPRGQKKKLQAREKRRRAQGDAQDCGGAKETAVVAEESTPFSKSIPESRSTAQRHQKAQCAIATAAAISAPPSTPTDVPIPAAPSVAPAEATVPEAPSIAPAEVTVPEIPSTVPAETTVPESPSTAPTEEAVFAVPTAAMAIKKSTSEATPSTDISYLDLVAKKVTLLEQFLLYKYNIKQLTTKEDMLKVISKKYKNEFAEIFRRASEHLAALFAVEVREVDSSRHSYKLVSKMKLPNNGRIRAGRGLPKTGLLMNVLGMIFMKGNCASEEDIWKYLKLMRVYPGKKHYIYGEPRKLITQDLVRLKYLEYRQVRGSDPPRYEFLWGPQAHAETSKMKVLEFLVRVNKTAPSYFSSFYEEALKDEKERAQILEAAKSGTTAKISASSLAICPAPDPTQVEV
uniref:Melanoma-associated antigen B5-like n=1 Tax=Castor canadensis TaxID=51338 RepID=A0A8B7TK15_CASCN|nr:melanoma-associated antigen B5-like [Castor canadensis]